MSIKVQSTLPDRGNIIVPFKLNDLEAILKELQIENTLEGINVQAGSSTRVFTGNSYYDLICLGESTDYKKIKDATWKYAASMDKRKLVVPFIYIHPSVDQQEADAILSGIISGCYDIAFYKEKEKSNKAIQQRDFAVYAEHIENVKSLAQKVWLTSLAQMALRDLINAPANCMTATDLAEWTVDSGATGKYEVKVLDRNDLTKLGCEAILAVNKGSEEEPKMIVVEYFGDPDQKNKSFGLVGKGVTFDTGGVSIKGAQNMHYMKSDMGGGGVVLTTIDLIARLKLPINIVGVVPATDNMVDGKSIVPGDVISSHSGKTIEVIDTDAEGRLLLADGLSYVLDNYSPDYLIDMATLTGSAVRTFGYNCAAILGNDQELIDQLVNLGQAWGEKVWPLPLWDDYQSDMASDVADVKNYSGRPLAGAIDAAIFLQHFIKDHPNWIHLDIAGVSFGQVPGSKDKSATGYGPKLMLELILKMIH